ncbi:Uncharacterised protein [uncultured archaeon]|nr:Uncharacterised protein [uncultured archaeon]
MIVGYRVATKLQQIRDTTIITNGAYMPRGSLRVRCLTEFRLLNLAPRCFVWVDTRKRKDSHQERSPDIHVPGRIIAINHFLGSVHGQS